MAKSTVPVNFKDDIMNSAMGGKRRYRMINNSDGTISLEDVTTYDQVGSTFGAAQINATNKAVNAAADASKVIDDIDAIRATTQEGYMAGALALKQVDDSLGEDENGMTIHEKLDYLMNNGVGSSLKLVGTLEGNGSISLTSLENYEQLTTDDFILVPINFYIKSTNGSSGNGSGTFYPLISYEPSTGTLTVSGCKGVAKKQDSTETLYGIITVKIYCLK